MAIRSSVIIEVELLINSVVQRIRQFTFQAPKNALGATLEISLMNPLMNVSTNDIIDFSLGVTLDGVTSWIPLIEQGIIAGQRARVEWQGGDKLSINAMSLITDRWLLAPSHSIIMYDTEVISWEEIELGEFNPQSLSNPIDEDWRVILPQFIAMKNLSLKQVLVEAYVYGCGFSKVITNIPDYRIRRADFTLGTSWHAVAQSFVGLYTPVYFADDNDILYIIDIDGVLPTGMTSLARTLNTARYRGTTFTQPNVHPINAVMLTFKETFLTDNSPYTDRITYDTSPETPVTIKLGNSGGGHNRGWAQTTVETHYRDYHDDPEHPNIITRSIAWKTVTINYAAAENTGLAMMISRETLTDLYTANFKLKLGYDKILEAQIHVPYAAAEVITMMNVLTETNRIKWARSKFNPDEHIKIWEQTDTEGLVIIEGEYFENNLQMESRITSAVPVMEAGLNRQITHDGFQQLIRTPISTVISFCQDNKTNQIQIMTAKTDHLIPQTEFSKTTQTIGSNAVNISQVVTKTMYIPHRDEDGNVDPILRIPESIDAGEVPFFYAYPIAKRRLDRTTATQREVEFDLPFFDAALRRGSLRNIGDRVDVSDLYLVTGYSIKSNDLGGERPEIYQTAEALMVQNV